MSWVLWRGFSTPLCCPVLQSLKTFSGSFLWIFWCIFSPIDINKELVLSHSHIRCLWIYYKKIHLKSIVVYLYVAHTVNTLTDYCRYIVLIPESESVNFSCLCAHSVQRTMFPCCPDCPGWLIQHFYYKSDILMVLLVEHIAKIRVHLNWLWSIFCVTSNDWIWAEAKLHNWVNVQHGDSTEAQQRSAFFFFYQDALLKCALYCLRLKKWEPSRSVSPKIKTKHTHIHTQFVWFDLI